MSDGEHLASCLCGAIGLSAAGAPLWVGLCHCRSCRRATGGVLMAAAGFPRQAVSIERGQMSYYASSPGVRRGFCGTCGTSLSYENARWPGDIHLMIGAFEKFRPRSAHDWGAIPPPQLIFAATYTLASLVTLLVLSIRNRNGASCRRQN